MNSAKAVIALMLALVPAGVSLAQGIQPGEREAAILAQIRNHHQGIALWWMGNDGWLIKAGEILFATDLDLEREEKVFPPPIRPELLAEELDVAFVSHHHGDHFNGPTLQVLSRKPKCRFVLPRTCLDEAGKLGISRDRIVVPSPGSPFEVKSIGVEPIHAIHGNQDFTVLTRESDFVDSIASNCGYVFTVQGKRILQPGDSVLTEEHLNLKNIDILFVSPTVHNMHVDRSMILINRLEPAHVFPQHFETYRETPDNQFWTKGYPDELQQRLSMELKKRYHKLKQGEMFVVPR